MTVKEVMTCPECKRRFDLMDEDDAGEWYYGHDCDRDYEPEVPTGPITVTVEASSIDMQDGTKWRYAVLVSGDPLMHSAAVYDTEQEALADSVDMQNCYREIHSLPPLGEVPDAD